MAGYFSGFIKNRNNFIGQLRVQHFILVLGHVSFLLIAFYLPSLNIVNGDAPFFNNICVILPSFCIFCSLLIFTVFVWSTNRLDLQINKTEKIGQLFKYRKAVVIRWALFGSMTSICIIAYLILKEACLFVLSIFMILVMVNLYPNKRGILGDINLTKEDEYLLS